MPNVHQKYRMEVTQMNKKKKKTREMFVTHLAQMVEKYGAKVLTEIDEKKNK